VIKFRFNSFPSTISMPFQLWYSMCSVFCCLSTEWCSSPCNCCLHLN